MLELIEGWDNYNASGSANSIAQNFWLGGGNTFSPGRFGGWYVQNGSPLTKLLPSGSLATRTIGLAFSPLYRDGTILELIDSATSTAQISVTYSYTTKNLSVYVGGTLLAACAGSVVYYPGFWYYIEIGATINSSTGSVLVKSYPGGTILNLTSVNTQASGNASFDTVGVAYNINVDDLYVTNPSGSVNTGFLGETKVVTTFPTGDSAANHSWTPSTGTAHYACAIQGDPTGDSPSVSANTVGLIDTYTFPVPSITGTISGLKVSVSARKDDAGTRQIASEFRDNSGTEHTGTTQDLLSGYSFVGTIYDKNPATSAAWTSSDLAGAEFGVKVIA